MNRGGDGWRKEYERRRVGDFSPDIVVPSGWDKLLRELKVPEDEALELLELLERGWRCPEIESLADFVRANCRNRFVPERVLEVLGLAGEVESFWARNV